MSNQIVTMSSAPQQPTASIGGVFSETLAVLAHGMRAAGNLARAIDNVSYSAVVMSEGFAKVSMIEQDLKLREATALLQIKTAALNDRFGLSVEPPVQPAPRPALQM